MQIPVGAQMWVLCSTVVFNEKSHTILTACTYRNTQVNLLNERG